MNAEYIIKIQGEKVKSVANNEKIMMSVNMTNDDIVEFVGSAWTLLGNDKFNEILKNRGYSLTRQRKKKLSK